ncbi:MAG: hypothetical protein Q8903_02900 [Bacteroidota bacterium]|nr:hypothetical protein [Bacteroidota bacterium]
MKIIIIILFVAATFTFPQNALKLQSDADKIKDVSIKLNTSTSTLVNGKKNAGLAIIYSLLLPGMGELYAGNYSSGKYFTAAEGLLWVSYIGMNSYAGWKKDDYKALAVKNAGVSPDGKDELFYANIGDYASVDNFNNTKTLEMNFSEMYDANKYYWKWNSTNDRKNYRDLWVKSEQAYNDVRFIVGAMIVNRIVSAINAVRLVSKYNKNLSTELSWNLSTNVSRSADFSPQININFQTSF